MEKISVSAEDTNTEQSEAYLILKLLIESGLLIIRYVDLLNLLNTLQGQQRITIEECNELLSFGDHLKNYDLAISE
jgi:hypothetical protein